MIIFNIYDQYNIISALLVMQGVQVGKRAAGNGIGVQKRLHDKTASNDCGDFADHSRGGGYSDPL